MNQICFPDLWNLVIYLRDMKVIWICFLLRNTCKFMSGYLYFHNNLKDKKTT